VKLFIRTILLCPLLFVGFTAGCSSQGPDSAAAGSTEGPSTEPNPSQARPAATRTELEQAVSDLGGCLSSSGIGLVNSGLDPVTQHRFVLSFPAPGLSDDKLTSVVDSCRSKHLNEVEARFMEAHPPEMAPELLESTTSCLADKGIRVPAGVRSPYELVETLPENRQEDLAKCVLDNMQRLYPKLPSYSFP
jgi:hypothetical protein